jgi:hypothetical protein
VEKKDLAQAGKLHICSPGPPDTPCMDTCQKYWITVHASCSLTEFLKIIGRSSSSLSTLFGELAGSRAAALVDQVHRERGA